MRLLDKPGTDPGKVNYPAPSNSPRPTKEDTTARSGRRILLTIARLAVGIGLIVYLAKSGLIHFQDFERLFTLWPLTLAALGLILLHITLISSRLSLLFRPQGLTLPLRTSLRLTLVGLFFDMFLPGASGGTVAKLFYATRESGDRWTDVATVVVFDRVIGLFSLLVLPLIFVPLFPELVSGVHILHVILIAYIAIICFLVAVFLVCLLRRSIVNRFARIIPYKPAKRFVSRGLETIGAYRHRPATLLSALGLSLLANLSIIGVIGLALLVVNPSSLAWKLCLLVPIGQIVNSLPITPGGLGVGEVAFNTLFKVSGLSSGAEAMLCWRIWTVLISGVGLFFYVRGMGRCIIETGGSADATSQGTSKPEVAPSLPPQRCDYTTELGIPDKVSFQ